jgi:hypothetical protein
MNLQKCIHEWLSRSKQEINIMGLNARRLAEKEFDWKIVGAPLLKTIAELHHSKSD